MSRRAVLARVALGALLVTLPAAAPPPAVDFRERATPYAGPGRDHPAPAGLTEIRIGYFGPHDPADPEGGAAWKAALAAVDAANRQGGLEGKPFRLVPAWSPDPWRAGASTLAKLVYHEQIWAIVGGPDGPSTHLAEQIVAKANLPLIAPTNADRTANAANVPWIVSLLPADHLQAPVVAAELERPSSEGGFVILSADDHDSRMFVRQLDQALFARKLGPRLRIELAGNQAIDEPVRQLIAAQPRDAVVVADAATSARLVRALRQNGFPGRILGSGNMGRARFVAEAGPDAEGVLFPLLYEPKTTAQDTPVLPDYSAAYTFDAVQLAIAAIRRGGLNRARIGDALHELAPFPGVTGSLSWDKLGSTVKDVPLGTIQDGQILQRGGQGAVVARP